MRRTRWFMFVLAAIASDPRRDARANRNLLADPSFEITKGKDQFGLVFARWGGLEVRGRL